MANLTKRDAQIRVLNARQGSLQNCSMEYLWELRNCVNEWLQNIEQEHYDRVLKEAYSIDYSPETDKQLMEDNSWRSE